MDGVHERRRSAHECFVAQVGRNGGGELIDTGQALDRLEPVDGHEARRIPAREGAEFLREDDGLLVAVGVEEHDLAGPLGEGGLEDRDHRRDATTCREQQEVVVQ